MNQDIYIYFADHVPLPLPEGHRFPADKYEKTRLSLMEAKFFQESQFLPSPLISKDDLKSVHDPDYIEAVFQGDLSSLAQKKIGFPWSEDLVNRCRASTGGPLAAARQALNTGYGAQLAGGTHHAHRDFGAGYCVFNDFAVTADVLLREQLVRRIAVIDLDVHHGDGNASMMTGIPEIFVFSMHGAKNYPSKKPASDLDIALDDDTSDQQYLRHLEEAILAVGSFQPDLILYQGGVDPLIDDRLGRLKLSFAGLKRRDELVFTFAKEFSIPIAHVLGGGYSRPIGAPVTAYTNTFLAAKASHLF